MAGTDLQQFASKLGRPAGSLPAFAQLSPEQIGMLSAAIDRACAQRRETLGIENDRLNFLDVIPADQLRTLREALYERLFGMDLQLLQPRGQST